MLTSTALAEQDAIPKLILLFASDWQAKEDLVAQTMSVKTGYSVLSACIATPTFTKRMASDKLRMLDSASVGCRCFL